MGRECTASGRRSVKRFAWTTLAIAIACAHPFALAADDPNDYVTSDFYITSLDGTPLHTVLFRPKNPPAKTPVIVEVTPYLTSGATPLSPQDAIAPVGYGPGSLGSPGRIFEKGYSYAMVALRGFGASGGCYDFGGYGEQMDVIAAVKWAANQPWSSGKVGMWGTSYPGGTQVMAMAARNAGYLGEELAAVVPKSPPTGFLNLFTAYTNPVRNTGSGHAIPLFYTVSDLLPPSLYDTSEHHLTALTGTVTNPLCYPDGFLGSYSDDPSSPYWVEREVGLRAAGSMVPTLWVQGFNDWQVRPPNSLPVYTTLAGPHRGIFGPWDHGISSTEGDLAFVHHAIRWYDCWLKEGADRVCTNEPTVLVQDVAGNWRAEEEWPPPDAERHDLPLLDSTYVGLPGNFSETGFPQVFPVDAPVPLPGGQGAWTFTEPLSEAVHFAGVPRVTGTVDSLLPNVHVVVLLYEIDADGNAWYVDRGTTRVAAAGPVAFDLYPHDWTIAAGHRLGVLVTGADDLWFEPAISLLVTLHDAALSLPLLGDPRPALPSGPFLPRTPHAPIHVDVTAERTTHWSPL